MLPNRFVHKKSKVDARIGTGPCIINMLELLIGKVLIQRISEPLHPALKQVQAGACHRCTPAVRRGKPAGYCPLPGSLQT